MRKTADRAPDHHKNTDHAPANCVRHQPHDRRFKHGKTGHKEKSVSQQARNQEGIGQPGHERGDTSGSEQSDENPQPAIAVAQAAEQRIAYNRHEGHGAERQAGRGGVESPAPLQKERA